MLRSLHMLVLALATTLAGASSVTAITAETALRANREFPAHRVTDFAVQAREAHQQTALRYGESASDSSLASRALPAVSRVARLTQEGVEHIALRHFPTSGASGAGKFATSSLREVRSLINEAVEKGAVRANTAGRPGNIFEYDFGRQIGTNISGNAASNLRVVVTPEGVVKTAFPY